jgi:CheY-like chemotaxis protein
VQEVPSILVVDDDHDCRAELRELLEGKGFAVTEAADGQAALDYLVSRKDKAPSVIILDVVMPSVSGWELVAIIKSYYRLCRIPILIVSGADCPLALDHQTVDGYMRKPCDGDALLTAVAGLIQRHAQVQQPE